MVYSATYRNDDITKIINNLVGMPFHWLKRIKMGGVGSKRMIVKTLSPNLNFIKNSTQDINYANLELRPNGVIVYLNKGLETFAWPIPYYKLVVYKSEGLSIHANGNFIKFKQNKTYKENKSFINKLLNQKVIHQTTSNPLS